MEHWDKLNQSLEKIDGRLDKVDITLVRQEENLREHMRRTTLLEQEFKPVKAHVEQVRGAGKFIAVLATIVGLLAILGLL